MAKPLDDDLRKRMVGTMREVGCCRAVARQYRVAPSTVSRLMKRVKRTGSRAPGKMGGHRKRILEECKSACKTDPLPGCVSMLFR